MTGKDRNRLYIERKAQALAPAAPPTTDFDPETQIIVDREMFTQTRERLTAALIQIDNLKADRDRWQADCAKAEAELKREERRHLNTTKDKIVLQKEIAALTAKPLRKRTAKPG